MRTLAKIAFALAIATISLATLSASAGPRDDAQYSAGYLDNAYNKHGW